MIKNVLSKNGSKKYNIDNLDKDIKMSMKI